MNKEYRRELNNEELKAGLKTKTHTPTLPPFISVFHHKHGISVQVLPGGTDQGKYWEVQDGFEDDEDEYFQEFPLPEPIVRAVNSYKAHVELVEEIIHHLSKDLQDISRIREMAKAIAKAEGL